MLFELTANKYHNVGVLPQMFPV